MPPQEGGEGYLTTAADLWGLVYIKLLFSSWFQSLSLDFRVRRTRVHECFRLCPSRKERSLGILRVFFERISLQLWMLLIHKCSVGLWSAQLEKLQLLASTSFLYLLSTNLNSFILWIISSFWNWTTEIFFFTLSFTWNLVWQEEQIMHWRTYLYMCIFVCHLVLLGVIIIPSKNYSLYSLFLPGYGISEKYRKY